ncbi:tetratricopeptide repeat protein [Bosea sp. LjRoot237]|uniref:tetratricopeptide repeat protein n=1 Tax=Bosea sp. LjRoot237 TaxID=3342292 RepID=UPI003ECDEA9C
MRLFGLVGGALTLLLSMGAAQAVGPDWTMLDEDPDYRQARRWIEEKNYQPAIDKLMGLLVRQPNSPELLNWIAFSQRKLKNYPVSKQFYDAALLRDPTYLPALEYQGEWFIETGDMASAKANLEKLAKLCGRCHEWQDLDQAIRAAEAK